MSPYQRGEVWLVDLGYVGKTRPCLIISTSLYDSDRALITLIAHTTSPRHTRFEVNISLPFLKPGVFDVQNLITIPHAKLVKKLGTLSSEQFIKVEKALRSWLQL